MVLCLKWIVLIWPLPFSSYINKTFLTLLFIKLNKITFFLLTRKLSYSLGFIRTDCKFNMNHNLQDISVFSIYICIWNFWDKILMIFWDDVCSWISVGEHSVVFRHAQNISKCMNISQFTSKTFFSLDNCSKMSRFSSSSEILSCIGWILGIFGFSSL